MPSDLLTALQQCLCPAGDGVFTVSTGRERKRDLQKILYGDAITEQWWAALNALTTTKNPCILGIPADNGGGILRGANWGPLHLRQKIYQHLSPKQTLDLGDVRVIPHLLLDDYVSTATLASCRQALYHDTQSTLPVSPLSITDFILTELYAVKPNVFVLGLGGDHSISYALLKPWIRSRRKAGKRPAIIHFDAHTDLLAQRLGIDICFGSWAYHILPELVAPCDLIQIGIRATQKSKATWESTLGVRQYWAHEVHEQGAALIADKISAHLQGVDEIYVTFDIDCIDSQYASATGTPEPQGLLPEQVEVILTRLFASHALTGGDVMEVAPYIAHHDVDDSKEPDSTLNIAAHVAVLLLQTSLLSD
jgi:agmatinase